MTLIEWLDKTRGPVVREYLGWKNEERKPMVIRECRKRLVCNDGFSMSVQEGDHLYSKTNNNGVVTHVEVGFPSGAVPELSEYCDGSFDPETGEEDADELCVFGYVPVEVLEQVIQKHGGIKDEP